MMVSVFRNNFYKFWFVFLSIDVINRIVIRCSIVVIIRNLVSCVNCYIYSYNSYYCISDSCSIFSFNN